MYIYMCIYIEGSEEGAGGDEGGLGELLTPELPVAGMATVCLSK
jgi:hypothetical protein